jgi:hypothetical protein
MSANALQVAGVGRPHRAYNHGQKKLRLVKNEKDSPFLNRLIKKVAIGFTVFSSKSKDKTICSSRAKSVKKMIKLFHF